MLRMTRQGYHKTASALLLPLPWSARSADVFPIDYIWDILGRRVGHPTSLNELEASTSDKVNKCHSINLVFVFGMRIIGKGHSAAKKLCSAIDVDVPFKKAFGFLENKFEFADRNIAYNTMKETTLEIRELDEIRKTESKRHSLTVAKVARKKKKEIS
ncbi:hypothetical protein TNCV_2224541 [Trichonephila clavipes]|nr:hypothetical protein TNCV_2224541 [Trichonephila clavipes]